MRTIKTTSGADVVLDGDLVPVLETLYREVTARRDLDRSFQDISREIAYLIAQMTEAERGAYLAESMFFSTVAYENQRFSAYRARVQSAALRGGRHPAASSE